MTDDELVVAGLFDPSGDSPRRADLVRRCLEVGLTVEEVRDAGDDLLPRAIDAVLRGGREQLTLAEVAERAGVDADMLDAFSRATGFASTTQTQRVWDEEDVASMAAMVAGREFRTH